MPLLTAKGQIEWQKDGHNFIYFESWHEYQSEKYFPGQIVKPRAVSHGVTIND
jgi:hypothetical protein